MRKFVMTESKDKTYKNDCEENFKVGYVTFDGEFILDFDADFISLKKATKYIASKELLGKDDAVRVFVEWWGTEIPDDSWIEPEVVLIKSLDDSELMLEKTIREFNRIFRK